MSILLCGAETERGEEGGGVFTAGIRASCYVEQRQREGGCSQLEYEHLVMWSRDRERGWGVFTAGIRASCYVEQRQREGGGGVFTAGIRASCYVEQRQRGGGGGVHSWNKGILLCGAETERVEGGCSQLE